MAYGKVAEQRKILSEVVTSISMEAEDQGININYDTVTVEGADVAVEPMGIPVVWSAAADNFVVFVAQDLDAADADGSPLPAGKKVALVVGDERGVGFNTEDKTLVAAGTDLSAVFNGSAGILNSGITWGAAAAPAQAAFLKELEIQGLTIVAEAPVAVTSYL